ncbi:unnamed protein product [Rhizoctonia solani]|nr:unnamed protein product [Rhizoctonia solani]
MSLADATALLVKIASSPNQSILDEDIEAAKELVQDFGCLSLAIVHAGAYIAHFPNMRISSYRSLFSSHRQRMLDQYKNLPETAKLDYRGDTVYTTWKLCYDQLKPESCVLLWLIAYLYHDGISEEIFKRAAQSMHSRTYPLPPTELEIQAQDHVWQYLSSFIDSDTNWDPIKFNSVMADLASYSLIESNRTNSTYRVHVLVHDWAKTVVPQSRELAVQCAATVLSLSINLEQDAESIGFKCQLELHVTSLLAYSPNLGANHCNYLKQVYLCGGQWIQKEKLELELLEVFQQELGDNDIQTWSIAHGLARTYRELGQGDKALDLQKRVVNAHKEMLGEEHPHTLASISNLAMAYLDLGQYDEAKQLQVHTLNIQKRVLGEYHPHTLASMSNLALDYLDIGPQDEAERLQIQVFNACRSVMGEEHPDTLTYMSNLAGTYSYLGRWDEAEELYHLAITSAERVLGNQHPTTQQYRENLEWMQIWRDIELVSTCFKFCFTAN